MNPHLLNPAGRLYEFMKHTWESSQQEALSASWRRYFDVESPTDHASFYGALASVLKLPDQIRERVAELANPPVPRSQLLRGVDGAQALLKLANTVESVNIDGARQQFHQGTLTDLETCSHILNNSLPALPDDKADEDAETTLDAIRRLAEEIISEVTASGSELPVEVARLLLDYASALIRAVDLFKITGVEGVVREFDGLVGALVSNPAAVSKISGIPAVWTRIVELSKEVVILGAAISVPLQIAIQGSAALKAIEPLIAVVAHTSG